MDITLRPARSTDADFLTTMLVDAAFWRVDGPSGTVEGVLHNPELAHYVADWPQSGDIGVVAEMDQPVGAAWLRYFTAEDPGYGFVDSSIPEVAMGVVRAKRGAGVGRSMLNALIVAAREAGTPALSLSVESDNDAMGLYRSTGFLPVTRANGSVTMTLLL